jgi:uncharacterized protein YbjT (DUF2867 family)
VSRIAIFGASSKLGHQLIAHALEAEHRVSALTREPSRIQRANPGLTVFRGDAETGEGLQAALGGATYVVSAINSSHLSVCTANLIAAMAGRKVQRWVFLSWVGAGDSALQATRTSGPMGPLLRRIERPMVDEISRAEGLVRTSGLPWVLMRATRLTDEVGATVVATSSQADPPRRVGRSDLARFIVRSLDEPGWDHREVSVGARRPEK